MTIATRTSERIGLASVQARAEARIEEHLRLENIRALARTHDCAALSQIDQLRALYRLNTPAFTGESPAGGVPGRAA